MKTYYDNNLKDYVYYISDIIEVVSVTPLDNYKLLLIFSNDEKRIFDAYPLLEKSAFWSLKNKGIFNQAHIECGTIVWNDDIDISSDSLYRSSILYDEYKF